MNSDTEVSKRFLTSVPFFTNLNPTEVDELARRLIPRRFQTGSTVFHLGDPGGLLYIILSGKIKISHSTPDGQEALLAIMGQGDFFACKQWKSESEAWTISGCSGSGRKRLAM